MSDLKNVPQFELLSNKKEKALYLFNLSQKFTEQELLGHFNLTSKQYRNFIYIAKKLLKINTPRVKDITKITDGYVNINSFKTTREKGLFILDLRKKFMPRDIRSFLGINQTQYQSYINSLREKKPKSYLKVLETRIKNFQTKAQFSEVITIEQFINKFGENPVCYLTGKVLDIKDPKSYVLDHFVPVSKNGSGDIDNLKPCDPLANIMKWNIEYEEFVMLCKNIWEYAKNKADETPAK